MFCGTLSQGHGKEKVYNYFGAGDREIYQNKSFICYLSIARNSYQTYFFQPSIWDVLFLSHYRSNLLNSNSFLKIMSLSPKNTTALSIGQVRLHHMEHHKILDFFLYIFPRENGDSTKSKWISSSEQGSLAPMFLSPKHWQLQRKFLGALHIKTGKIQGQLLAKPLLMRGVMP